MEKITFTSETKRDVTFGSADEIITMSFDSEGMTLDDFARYVRKFCLAIGYMPESVEHTFGDGED